MRACAIEFKANEYFDTSTNGIVDLIKTIEWLIESSDIEALAVFQIQSSKRFKEEPFIKTKEFNETLFQKNSSKIVFSDTATENYQNLDKHFSKLIKLNEEESILLVFQLDNVDKFDPRKIVVFECYLQNFLKNTFLEKQNIRYYERLHVLNEINNLIVSNVGLLRATRSITRECAFIFGAEVSIMFLLSEDGKSLEPAGTYGIDNSHLGKIALNQSGILEQVLSTGGHVSIASVPGQQSLSFLANQSLKNINICCLEVRGELLGVLLIGYKRDITISSEDLSSFEEFCQASAVAILNALTQERITSYNERLEELVAQRTQELSVQTKKAESANHAKSQFLANMSHELRTPLTAIVGYVDILADGLFGEVNNKQYEALKAVARSTDHLKKLIDDVLNLARIESGKEIPEPENYKVKDLIQHGYQMLLQTALKKGVSITPVEIDQSVQDTSIWADPKHMQQIIINLLSNAIKYTPAGGKVWISANKEFDKIKISVNDTGIGVPEDRIDKLFERFERGEDEYSKQQEGTGIGLNLTKLLVEINGGLIGAESTYQKGSCFWFMLPIASNPTVEVLKEEKNKLSSVRLDGITTLVVDDNKETCEVLNQILLASGAKVKLSNCIEDAKKIIADSQPDIILTDIAMPGGSGIDLINYLKNTKEKEISKIPVIVLSACAFSVNQKSALDAGAKLFIPKPFKPLDVVSNVRKLAIDSMITRVSV